MREKTGARWKDPRLAGGVALIAAGALAGAYVLRGPVTVPVYRATEAVVPVRLWTRLGSRWSNFQPGLLMPIFRQVTRVPLGARFILVNWWKSQLCAYRGSGWWRCSLSTARSPQLWCAARRCSCGPFRPRVAPRKKPRPAYLPRGHFRGNGQRLAFRGHGGGGSTYPAC